MLPSVPINEHYYSFYYIWEIDGRHDLCLLKTNKLYQLIYGMIYPLNAILWSCVCTMETSFWLMGWNKRCQKTLIPAHSYPRVVTQLCWLLTQKLLKIHHTWCLTWHHYLHLRRFQVSHPRAAFPRLFTTACHSLSGLKVVITWFCYRGI